jgi:hypothetical protein
MGRKGTSKYTGKFKAGHTFGLWTVVDGKIHGSPARMDVKCTCDTIHRIDVYTLVKGKSTSCGCIPRTGESAPNWRGLNGVSGRTLNNASNTFHMSVEDVAKTFTPTCYLTGQTLTSNNAVPYANNGSDSFVGTTDIAWVHTSVSPLVNQYGITGAITIANSISQTTNIFQQMGMKPTEKP